MNKAISDRQYSTLIGTIARIPVEQARRLFLERIEQALPKAGKVSDEQLLSAVNSALSSFTPGQYRFDQRGLIPDIDEATSLIEAADIAERDLRGPTWVWPPLPPEPEDKDPPLVMSDREMAASYARSLGLSDGDVAQPVVAAANLKKLPEPAHDGPDEPMVSHRAFSPRADHDDGSFFSR
jgi:hypothetical protein